MHNIAIPAFARERGRMMRPLKPLDAKKTAVIAIDFQRFFIDEGQPMGNPHARDIIENANRLHATVRERGGLVIFTQHSIEFPVNGAPSPDRGHLMELSPRSASYDIHPGIHRDDRDLTIIKYQSSPLHAQAKTDLENTLRHHGMENVIITGLVTNGCCDCTARDAYQHGFHVVLASDATAAMTDEEHNGALLSLAIYYAEIMTAAEIAQSLADFKPAAA